MNALPRVSKIAGFLTRILLMLVCCGSSAAFADSTRPLSHYVREVWTTRDGLPHNLVNGIAQTDLGYLWFATWEGAVSYNGRQFRLYGRDQLPNMPDEGYRAVVAARDGSVWFGSSRGGIARVRDGRWDFYDQNTGLSHNEVMVLLESRDGSLWIGYQFGGVDRRYPDGRVEHVGVEDGLASPLVNALHEGDDGRLWIGTGVGLALLEGGSIRTFGESDGLPSGSVFAVQSLPNGDVLVGGEFGLYVRRGERFRSFDSALDGVAIQRVLRDRNGTLWAGATHRGLYRLRDEGGVDYFGEDLGLPNQRIASMFEDREHSLWVGTSGGLMRLREGPFINVRQSQGLADDYVRTVFQAKDQTLWIGSSTGLARMRGEQVQRVGPNPLSVLTLGETADGMVLIGTYLQGVLRLVDGQVEPWLNTENGLPSNQVRALLYDSQHRVWVGTTRGLVLSQDGDQSLFDERAGLPREYVLSLHEDRNGRIWVGTDKGLAWFDHESNQFREVPLVDGAESVFGIAEDADGALWMAGDRGVLYRRGDKVRRIGYAHGMPVEKLFQVVLDGKEDVWVSSNRGVTRLLRKDAMAIIDGQSEWLNAELFTELDGMASAQCNGGSSPSAIVLDDRRLAFSTALGLSIVDPDEVGTFQPEPPPVVVERLSIDDQTVQPSADQSISAPPGSKRIEFGFAGLSYLRPQTIEYRYRLDGFDREWIVSNNRMSAEFTSLPPGDYVFRVAAALRHGLTFGSESSVKLRVLPFWWQRAQTWWWGSALLLLLAVVITRYRNRQQRHARQVLQRLVDERTEALRAQTERLVAADHERQQLLERLRNQSEAFERQAYEDALTGLANRRAFDEWLRREFARFQRLGQPLCLAVLDLDWFKRINDGFSHASGDQALQALAEVLKRKCRGMDIATRYGGEEFALILPNTELDEALKLAERLRLDIAAIDCSAFAPGESLTASLGVASSEACPDAGTLVQRADAALYQAKRGGRDQVCAWTPALNDAQHASGAQHQS